MVLLSANAVVVNIIVVTLKARMHVLIADISIVDMNIHAVRIVLAVLTPTSGYFCTATSLCTKTNGE